MSKMDIETAKTLTSIQGDIKEICKDQGEMKADIKDLKNIYTSLEKFSNLEVRVDKMEANSEKLKWIVILAIAERVLSLVLK
jgi:hypothetical protein